MSGPGFFGLLDAAKKYRAGGPGPKLTLLALMERMGETDQGWVCWPSMTQLAEDTEQGVSTVRRHVSAFEDAGLIRREARGNESGGRASNLFVLDVDTLTGANRSLRAGGQTAHSEGANRSSEGGQTAHSGDPSPYMEHPEELPGTSGAARKATLCPEPFVLTAEMHEWAAANIPAIDVRLETAQFCDYWRAANGPAAKKRDWVAAWRVWMRKATPPRRINGHTNGHQRPTGIDAVAEYARQEGLIL